jgi:hypothetical protein
VAIAWLSVSTLNFSRYTTLEHAGAYASFVRRQRESAVSVRGRAVRARL